MNDYEVLQEGLKVAGKYMAPLIVEHGLDPNNDHTSRAFVDVFMAGVQYAVDEMKGM